MEALKPQIRALANSCPSGGMTVAQLDHDFRSTEGIKIPFVECGFQSLEAMLRSMTDTVVVTTTHAGAMVHPILTAETQHIRDMVLKSKKNKKKGPSMAKCGFATKTNHSVRLPAEPSRNLADPPRCAPRSNMVEIKSIIRALVISNASRYMTVAQLQTDYKKLEGINIPYQRFGFATVNIFLQSMPDVVRVNGNGPAATVHPITNENTAHIQEMVNKSKKNTRHKTKRSAQPPEPYNLVDHHFHNFMQMIPTLYLAQMLSAQYGYAANGYGNGAYQQNPYLNNIFTAPYQSYNYSYWP